MFKNKLSILKPAVIYVGIILGAGFASGAEIMAYFVDYGKIGFFGLILSCLIFAFTGWAIWSICRKKNIDDYKTFMQTVMGAKFAFVMEIVLGLFMFIVFSAMLAAAGSAVMESTSLNYSSGVYIVATICFIVFLFDISGILKLNAYISPFLIAGCTLMGLFTFLTRAEPTFSVAAQTAAFMRKNWYMAATTYAGYNITTAVAILSAMKNENAGLKSTLGAALASGLILLLLGMSIFLSLSANYEIIRDAPVPMLTLAKSKGLVAQFSFMALFLGSCFTTAATNGFAVVETISGRLKISKTLLKIVITVLGIIAAYAGFSNFVKNIYPLFAIAGVIEILLIARYFIKISITNC